MTCPTCHAAARTAPPPAGLGRRRFLVELIAVGGASLTLGCTGEQLAVLGSIPLVPEPQVRALGLKTWQRLRAETPPSHDAGLNRLVAGIGRRLVGANPSSESSWEFVVFDDPQQNAFALPGGKVGFFTGILGLMENEDQVAAVMGHEITHVNARHGAQRLNAQQATSLAINLGAAALEAGNIAEANHVAAILGIGVQYGLILPYSRHQELEADRLGAFAMARAGYDPREAVRFWEIMSARARGGAPPEWLSTHPSNRTRITALADLMPQVLPIYEQNRRG